MSKYTPRKYQDRQKVIELLRSGKLDNNDPTDALDEVQTILAGSYCDGQLFYHFAAFWDDFLHGVSRRGAERSRHTIVKAAPRFAVLAKFLLERSLQSAHPGDVSSNHVRDFINRFNGTPRTKKQMYADVRQLFNWFVRHNTAGVKHNPCSSVPMPPHQPKPTKLIHDANLIPRLFKGLRIIPRKGTPEAQERARVLDLCLLTLFMVTGARRGGVASVVTSGLDFDAETLQYREKGGRIVTVAMGEAAPYLKRYLEIRNMPRPFKGELYADYLGRISEFNRGYPDRAIDPENLEADDILFRRPQDGFPATVDTIQHIVARWGRILGIALHPHMLRKYRGRDAYDQTHDLDGVRALLGHSSYEMTKRYLEIDADSRNEFVRRTSPLKRFVS